MNASHACPKCGATLPPNAPEGLCPACLMSGGLPSDAATVPMGDSPRVASQPMAPRTPEDLAPLFPQLEILELLGRGGMGAVYKARQKNLNRLVALKILTIDPAAEGGFGERFEREAHTLARLNHPNIVGIHDFGVADGLYFFVMEYVDGANLRSLIRAGHLQPEVALNLVPSLCEALQYAHDEGVVHRDIKPENVLVDKKGRVKIADFGLAKLLGQENADHGLTLTGMALGTPRYMAPEQLDCPESVDHRADIYSLGVVFYEMLTGEIPMGRFALPSERVRVDVRFDEIVLRTLERDVERRYQHASEVKTDVESVAQMRSTWGSAKSVPPAPASTGAAAVDWQAHDERQLAYGVWAGLSALSYLGICIALQGTIMTLRSCFTERFANTAAPFPWVQGLVFGVMLANAVIALVVLIKARNRGSDRFVRTGAINLVCAGALLTIACDNWFGVPGWLGSIYLGAAFIGWMVFRRPKIITAFKNLPAPSVAPPMGGARTSENPRLSRCALWGAIWAALGILVVPFLLVSMTVPVRAGSAGDAGQALTPSINMILMGVLFVLFVIGGSALIGTTIGIAVAQIKRSGGKLYGLPLAAGCLLIFPTLLLGAAVFFLQFFAFRAVTVDWIWIPGTPEHPPVTAFQAFWNGFMLVNGLVTLSACFFAARAVWRKVAPPQEKPATDTRTRIRRAAIGLLIAGVGNGLATLVLAMLFFDNRAELFSTSGFIVRLAALGVLGGISVLVFLGALKMLNVEDHAACRRAAILGLLCAPAGILCIPLAIWALVVLSRPEVKALFPSSPTVAGPKHRVRVLTSVALVILAAGAVPLVLNLSKSRFASLKPLIVADASPSLTPGDYHFRYRLSAPPDHRVVMWMEATRQGQPVSMGSLNNLVESLQESIGESMEVEAEFSLVDGERLSPDSRGKWRWDFPWTARTKTGTSNSSPGGWIDNPFSATKSTHIDQGPKRWEPKAGETVSLLVMREGYEGFLGDWTVKPPDGDFELRLKARIDAVPLFHRIQGAKFSSLKDPFPDPPTPLGRIAAGFEVEWKTATSDDDLRKAIIERISTVGSRRAQAEAILKSVGSPAKEGATAEELLGLMEGIATRMLAPQAESESNP